jgi:hypothetical protein
MFLYASIVKISFYSKDFCKVFLVFQSSLLVIQLLNII